MTRRHAIRNLPLTRTQLATVIGGSSSGIAALVAVSQLKSENADADALNGADEARDKIAKQKAVRDVQKPFE